MSGSSRSVWCQSFSPVRRLETEKMPKNRNANFLNFSVRSVRYFVRFDRYCVRGSWWTALGTVLSKAARCYFRSCCSATFPLLGSVWVSPSAETDFSYDRLLVFLPSARSSAARVSSAAPKKQSFDRGGPVWPPRSNVTNDRLTGGSGEALPPPAKNRGVWEAAPLAKTEKPENKRTRK